MSRFGTGDAIVVKPANNVFTGLAAAACLVVLAGLIMVIVRANDLFEGGLFGG